MSGIARRIKELREGLGISQEDFAQKIGEKVQRLKDVERGQQRPPADFIANVVEQFHVDADWILTGRGTPPLSAREESQTYGADRGGEIGAEFALIPQYHVPVSAGGGTVVEREPEITKLAFRKQWLRQKGLSPQDLIIIRITGDSMTPTIRDGSLVLVDTNIDHTKKDGIYVLMIDGHLVAKRLQRDLAGGGLFVRSDNPAYREQHLRPEEADRLHIIGKVVWVAGEI